MAVGFLRSVGSCLTASRLGVDDADTDAVAALNAARWRRYGKDRVYINDETGQRVGWLDVHTGTTTLDQPDRAAEFHEAIAQFLTSGSAPRTEVPAPSPPVDPPGGHTPSRDRSPHTSGEASSVASPTSPMSRDSAVASSSPAIEWVDLADRVPGQAARAKADEELAALREEGRVRAWFTRAFDVKTDERAWRVGADGEETVGAKLNRLRKHGWRVLHALPVGAQQSDIDHVLIGPGGVFTVNTKNHPGAKIWVGRHTVSVNGAMTHYLRNSRHEADRAQRLLTAACGFPVPVRPVLVFLTGTLVPDVTIKQEPDDVVVLDRMDIPGAFRRATRRLTEEQVAAIYEQARRHHVAHRAQTRSVASRGASATAPHPSAVAPDSDLGRIEAPSHSGALQPGTARRNKIVP